MSSARAFVLEQPNEPLQRRMRPIPVPGKGQVVVRNFATSVNFHDALNIIGLVPNLVWPRVPFSDNCGEIVALGEGCEGWKTGDRVVANFFPNWIDGAPLMKYFNCVYGDQVDGFLQDYTLVEAHALVRVPDYMTHAEAATLSCAGLTAWRSVVVEAKTKPGDVVVIQGTGGVSLFALQFAKATGAEVILLSSSDEKLELGRGMGADHLHNYRADPAWDRRVLEITGGRGADLVVEIGGAGTLERSINATRLDGHISVIGARSAVGQPANITAEVVLIKNLNLRGITVGNRRQLEEMCRMMELHRVRPVISHHFALEDVDAAVQLMNEQGHHGKIVIDIAG